MQKILQKQENIELILKGYNDCSKNILKSVSSKGEDMPLKLLKGSIRYREKEKCYEARITINYKQKSFYSKNKNECIRKANTFYKLNYNKLQIEYDNSMYFNDWLDVWFNMYKKPKLKMSTLINMESAINKHIKPYFKNKKLNSINAMMIDDYLSTIKNSRHKETVSTIVADIIKTAYQKDLIKKPIHLQITKYKHNRTEGYCLTEEQQRTLLENLQKVKNSEPILFAYLTGCRKHGVFNLTPEDIDFKNKKIHIRETKTKTSDRYIPITDKLDIFLKSLNLKKSPIFKMSDRQIKNMINQLSDLCGFRIHFKDMRTTYATKLRESDIPAEMIKKWLGHSSYSITEKYYIKLSESFENKEIEKLNQI